MNIPNNNFLKWCAVFQGFFATVTLSNSFSAQEFDCVTIRVMHETPVFNSPGGDILNWAKPGEFFHVLERIKKYYRVTGGKGSKTLTGFVLSTNVKCVSVQNIAKLPTEELSIRQAIIPNKKTLKEDRQRWGGREKDAMELLKTCQPIVMAYNMPTVDEPNILSKPETLGEYYQRWPAFIVRMFIEFLRTARPELFPEPEHETIDLYFQDIESYGGIDPLCYVRWSTRQSRGPKYIVEVKLINYIVQGSDALLLYSKGEPFKHSKHVTRTDRFRIDLEKGIVRPLNLNAWGVLDISAVSKRPDLWIKDDNYDISGIAPNYPLHSLKE